MPTKPIFQHCNPKRLALAASLLTYCLGLSLSSQAVAEDEAAALETITYEAAVERALQLDHRIAEKQHLLAVAEAQLAEVKGAAWPTISTTAGIGMAPDVSGGLFNSPDGDTNGNNQNIQSDETPGGYGVLYFIEARLIQPLYSFGKFTHYSNAAKGQIGVKEGDIAVQRAQTIMDVSKAWFGLIAARDARYLMEEAAERLENAAGVAEGMLEEEKDSVRQSDLYALNAGKSLVERYHAQTQGLENVAKAGLAFLIGMEPESFEIAQSRSKALPLPEETLEELQAKALVLRPEISQLKAGLEARNALVNVAKAEKLPNIFAGIIGQATYAPGRDQLNNPFIQDGFNSAGATPVLGVQWEWQTGRNPARVQQAQAELDALLQKQAFAQAGIPFQVAESYYQTIALHDGLTALNAGSRDARRWMTASYLDFEAGSEEASKVIQGLQAYVLAYGDYLRTVNDYNMEVMELRRRTGALK